MDQKSQQKRVSRRDNDSYGSSIDGDVVGIRSVLLRNDAHHPKKLFAKEKSPSPGAAVFPQQNMGLPAVEYF